MSVSQHNGPGRMSTSVASGRVARQRTTTVDDVRGETLGMPGDVFSLSGNKPVDHLTEDGNVAVSDQIGRGLPRDHGIARSVASAAHASAEGPVSEPASPVAALGAPIPARLRPDAASGPPLFTSTFDQLI